MDSPSQSAPPPVAVPPPAKLPKQEATPQSPPPVTTEQTSETSSTRPLQLEEKVARLLILSEEAKSLFQEISASATPADLPPGISREIRLRLNELDTSDLWVKYTVGVYDSKGLVAGVSGDFTIPGITDSYSLGESRKTFEKMFVFSCVSPLIRKFTAYVGSLVNNRNRPPLNGDLLMRPPDAIGFEEDLPPADSDETAIPIVE